MQTSKQVTRAFHYVRCDPASAHMPRYPRPLSRRVLAYKSKPAPSPAKATATATTGSSRAPYSNHIPSAPCSGPSPATARIPRPAGAANKKMACLCSPTSHPGLKDEIKKLNEPYYRSSTYASVGMQDKVENIEWAFEIYYRNYY